MLFRSGSRNEPMHGASTQCGLRSPEAARAIAAWKKPFWVLLRRLSKVPRPQARRAGRNACSQQLAPHPHARSAGRNACSQQLAPHPHAQSANRKGFQRTQPPKSAATHASKPNKEKITTSIPIALGADRARQRTAMIQPLRKIADRAREIVFRLPAEDCACS